MFTQKDIKDYLAIENEVREKRRRQLWHSLNFGIKLSVKCADRASQ